MKNIMFWAITVASIAVLSVGCKKDDTNKEDAVLSIRLTDAPASYDAVYIDLAAIELTGNQNQPIQINVIPGIYNLLDFTNGTDTLIAIGGLPSGRVQQIRLILGNNNSVVVNGVSHPLSTPSAQQTGLKLQWHQDLEPGIAYMVLLDFDAGKSIVEEGNGTYSLKPVIRIIDTAISGSIQGAVNPPGEICYVEAVDANNNSFSSYSDSTGGFLISGVPAGSYTVTVTPDPPLVPVVINNVTVNNGSITQLGTVNL